VGTSLQNRLVPAGIGLATLSITGILMYWNRYLRHIAGATFTTPESPVPAA